jgi:hypothetical protein
MHDNLQLPVLNGIIKRRPVEIILGLFFILLAIVIFHGSRIVDNIDYVQWEDKCFINHNAAMINSLPDCFTERPVWSGLYRPLTTNLYFYIGRTIFNNNIRIYHIISIVFYALNAFLLYYLSLLFISGYWAMAPPILWVSRLANAEIVTNSCEFQVLFAVFLAMISLILFIKYRMGGRYVHYILSYDRI